MNGNLKVLRVGILSFFLISTFIENAQASFKRDTIEGRLKTQLTQAELDQEKRDEKRFPNLMNFIQTVNVKDNIYPTDPRNKKWIQSAYFFKPSPEMWDGFFKAAAKDRVTCLRAFVLLARELKKNGVVMFGPGDRFEEAIRQNRIDLGLSVPAKNVGAAIWSPDPAHQDSEFQVHVKIFYSEPFVHQFPDEILPANLKIGQNDPDTYYWKDQKFYYPSIDADIFYGEKNGVGFRNVKGIGGQKRGVLGFFQKVLFFLPDAIDAMVIHPEKDELVTEAIVNTTVEHFEENALYSIKVKSES